MVRSLDHHRQRRGIAGNLCLLRFKSKGAYDKLLEIDDGWSLWPVRQNEAEKTAFAVEAQIDESADDARNLEIETAYNDATDFAVEGVVYKIERERSHKSFLHPKRWVLQGYITGGRWPHG